MAECDAAGRAPPSDVVPTLHARRSILSPPTQLVEALTLDLHMIEFSAPHARFVVPQPSPDCSARPPGPKCRSRSPTAVERDAELRSVVPMFPRLTRHARASSFRVRPPAASGRIASGCWRTYASISCARARHAAGCPAPERGYRCSSGPRHMPAQALSAWGRPPRPAGLRPGAGAGTP